MTAQMGGRHLGTPLTTCHNTWCVPRGLGPAWGLPPRTRLRGCERGRGRHQPGRLWGLGRRARGARCRVRAADPLPTAVSAGGDGAQEDPFPTRHSQGSPRGRGEGVCERPYSHHQATDHPGHHPAASEARGAPGLERGRSAEGREADERSHGRSAAAEPAAAPLLRARRAGWAEEAGHRAADVEPAREARSSARPRRPGS